MLIDTHVHLDSIDQVEQVIENARATGIKGIIAVGMNVTSNRKTLKLSRQFPDIAYPAIGYHPWLIRDNEIEETLLFIQEHLDLCVALGEVGLDYKVKVKKKLQQEVFASVLGLAQEKNKPVIVHSRFSHQRTHKMVSDTGIEKAVFHWYSGPAEILDRILIDGYYISATPALAYSPPHQSAITKTPLERILIETDAPVEYRGEISEPANLVDTLRELSRIKNVPANELAQITSQNARRCFGI